MSTSVHQTRSSELRRAPQAVRLTRRGRLVVFVGSMAMVLGTGLALAGGAMGTTESGEQPASRVVVVDTGETLWGIASEVSAPGEVREVMREIEELNGLDSAVLQAGQRLRVPVGE